MASQHEIIGEEWRLRATELADWAMSRLVNRKDVWGQYSVLTPTERRQGDRTYKAMTLPARDQRGQDRVTLNKLTRHFSSRRHRKPQLIGLHAKSTDTTSRWFGIDVDCHDTGAVGAEDLARRNLNAVVSWYRVLQNQGFDPLLFDSNGAGGYHLWVLFAEPAPTADVFAFAQTLVGDWQAQQLERLPETFPKAVKADSLGSWFRLPGLHHTRDHYSSIWAGDEGFDDPWLTGHAAIDTILAAVPGPPPPPAANAAPSANNKPAVLKANPLRDAEPGHYPPAPTSRRFKRTGRASVCVDLDGVLATRTSGQTLGTPTDGAVEFTRALHAQADIIIHTARFATSSGKPHSDDAMAALEKRIRHWLDAHGFAYTEISTGVAKPLASAYVDDRAVPCRPAEDGPAAFDDALRAVHQLCNSNNE